jgi:hypothetical protein
MKYVRRANDHGKDQGRKYHEVEVIAQLERAQGKPGQMKQGRMNKVDEQTSALPKTLNRSGDNSVYRTCAGCSGVRAPRGLIAVRRKAR